MKMQTWFRNQGGEGWHKGNDPYESVAQSISIPVGVNPNLGATTGLYTVIHAVVGERVRQDEKWGGPKHDDNHYMEEWHGFIRREMDIMKTGSGDKTTRQRYIRIAALAVAACESLNRSYGMK